MRAKIRRRLFGSKRRAIATIVAALALIGGGAALAQFFLFSNADGSGQGTYGAAQTAIALTVTGANQPVIPGPGDQVPMSLNVVNHDTQNPQTLATLAASFTSSPSVCASHLSAVRFGGEQGALATYPAGYSGPSLNGGFYIKTDASTPVQCASGSWNVTFTGTTTP